MPVVHAESLVAQLQWRYAVKKFDPARKIPEGTWHALEHALMLSPSSYGLQPWRFVVVTDPAIKERLPAISWNQTQPRDCSHLVVFAARRGINAADVERFVNLIVRERAVPADALADYKAVMLGTIGSTPPEKLDEWSARQVYIALGVFLTSAAMLGVDACPMEGIQAAAYDTLLGLESTGYRTIVCAAAGYRAPDDWLAPLKKVRFPSEELVLRR